MRPLIGAGQISHPSEQAQMRATARTLEHRATAARDGAVVISPAMARQVALWLREQGGSHE